MAQFSSGSHVTIHSLTSDNGKFFNDCTGTIGAWNPKKKRFTVHLDPEYCNHPSRKPTVAVRVRNIKEYTPLDFTALRHLHFVCTECREQFPIAQKKMCSSCKIRAFCSTNCFRKAWKNGHKQECQTLQKMDKLAKKEKDVHPTSWFGNQGKNILPPKEIFLRDMNKRDSHFLRAVRMMDKKKYDKAINHFRKAYVMDGATGLDALLNRLPLLRFGKHTKGEYWTPKFIIKSMRETPDGAINQDHAINQCVFTIFQLGQAYLAKKDYINAIRHLELCSEFFPQRVGYTNMLVICLYQLFDKDDENQKYLKKAIRLIEPMIALLESGKADLNLHMQKDEKEDTLKSTSSIDFTTCRISSYDMFAKCKVQGGDLSGAMEMFELVWDLDKNNAGSFKNMLDCWMKMWAIPPYYTQQQISLMISRIQNILKQHKKCPMQFGDRYMAGFVHDLEDLKKHLKTNGGNTGT